MNQAISIIGFFLLYGFAIHMLVTSIGNKYLNKLIALLMMARGSQTLYFILIGSGQMQVLQHLFKLFNFFYFAAPACSYLYFKGFLREESRLGKWEWLHFLPLLLPLADLIRWYQLEASTRTAALLELQNNTSIFIKSSLGLFSNQFTLLFCTLLFLCYLLMSARLLYKARVIRDRKKNPQANNWLLFLYGFLFSVQLVRLMPFVSKYLFGLHQLDTTMYEIYVAISTAILLTAVVFILYNPKIMYGYVFLTKEFNRYKSGDLIPVNETSEEVQQEGITTENEKSKANPSAVLQKNEKLYQQKIVEYMEQAKPYLHPDFSINLLSHEMNLPLHHCSYIVNYVIGKNFREWVNGYRIAHFIREYPEQIKTKTILSLSSECGFKNKNTFYSAFKHEMGVAPSEYFQAYTAGTENHSL